MEKSFKSLAWTNPVETETPVESRNIIGSLCDLCIADETHVEANAFCQDCQQLLCPSCHKVHQSDTDTSQHQVHTGQDRRYSIDKATNTRSTRSKRNHEDDCSSRKAVYVRQIEIASPTDERKAVVTSIEVLPDGCLLVCDYGNKNLKLFDTEYEVLSVVRLSSEPWGIVALTSRDALVNLPEMYCLQTVKIRKKCKLVLEEKRKTIFKCYKMIKYQEDLIVSAQDDFYYFIYIIDTSGKVIRCIYSEPKQDGGILQNVQSLSLSKDTKIIYIANKWLGFVGLSLTGTVMFKYSEAGETNHVGVCKDWDNLVYISCCDLDKVVMISDSGVKVKDLLILNGMNPECIAYSEIESKLFIYSGSTKKLLCFKLKS